jgi:hypothetical protein
MPRIPLRVGRLRVRWSHVFADTEYELRAFAHAVGPAPQLFSGLTKRLLKLKWAVVISLSWALDRIIRRELPLMWTVSLACCCLRLGAPRFRVSITLRPDRPILVEELAKLQLHRRGAALLF